MISAKERARWRKYHIPDKKDPDVCQSCTDNYQLMPCDTLRLLDTCDELEARVVGQAGIIDALKERIQGLEAELSRVPWKRMRYTLTEKGVRAIANADELIVNT